jgi:hypothetical protein
VFCHVHSPGRDIDTVIRVAAYHRTLYSLGGALLQDLLDEGQASALPVRIHVETFNPAMRLYLRLGFNAVEDQGVYQLLEWQPVGNDANAS